MGKKRKFTEEEFVDAWMRNSSRSEICYELGLTPNGNTQRITDYAQELGLPSDHIVYGKWSKKKNDRSEFYKIRKYIKDNSILDYSCNSCGIKKWMGVDISLELDHIDGDRKNNKLINLQWLCPNCHSQTDTHGAGENNSIKECISENCNNFLSIRTKSNLCKKCRNDEYVNSLTLIPKENIQWERLKISLEEFIKIWNSSMSVKDVCISVHGNYRSKKAKELKIIAYSIGLNEDHMDRNSMKPYLTHDYILNNYLNMGSNRLGKNVIRKIKEYNIVGSNCSLCGLGYFYNNNNLMLHLDHINGNRCDNRIENLRLLCPNCHSQTDTWRSKNKKSSNPEKFCISCRKPIGKRSERCKDCSTLLFIKNYSRKTNPTKQYRKDGTLIERPDKESLLEILLREKGNLVKTSHHYGVSDNAVRKWLRKYNIPTKSKELKSYLKEF